MLASRSPGFVPKSCKRVRGELVGALFQEVGDADSRLCNSPNSLMISLPACRDPDMASCRNAQ